MCDGHGIAVSTDLTWEENPGKTHQQIYALMQSYLGIDTYHVIPDALGEYIKHIDCTAKFLAPDKVMVIEVPPSAGNYTELEAQAAWFAATPSIYGWPYQVYRVYCPNGQPYVNSLILNDKVLMPVTGSSWDDDAIASYQAALPGYEVLGFTGSWASTDALHCRTMGITDSGMLYVHHTPLKGQVVPGPAGFAVEAEVIAYSGQGFVNNTPKLYWKTTGSWSSAQMTAAGGDVFEAAIPVQPDGTAIYYYINAQDGSGRSENHPYMGAAAAHTFTAYDQIDSTALETSAKTISTTEKLTDLCIAGRYVGLEVESNAVNGSFRWGKPTVLLIPGDLRR